MVWACGIFYHLLQLFLRVKRWTSSTKQNNKYTSRKVYRLTRISLCIASFRYQHCSFILLHFNIALYMYCMCMYMCECISRWWFLTRPNIDRDVIRCGGRFRRLGVIHPDYRYSAIRLCHLRTSTDFMIDQCRALKMEMWCLVVGPMSVAWWEHR